MSEAAEALSGSIAPAVRDSIFRAREQQTNRTMVVLDYVADMGTVMNRRQGNTDGTVMAKVAAVDTMQPLGMPGDRARRALQLCVGN